MVQITPKSISRESYTRPRWLLLYFRSVAWIMLEWQSIWTAGCVRLSHQHPNRRSLHEFLSRMDYIELVGSLYKKLFTQMLRHPFPSQPFIVAWVTSRITRFTMLSHLV